MYDDEWMSGFSAKAALRLKVMFEADLDVVPLRLAELLKKLKESEEATAAIAA